MANGLPAGAVLLDAPGPSPSGLPATIDVRNDSSDRITAEVNAAGSGYLVVADAMQDKGWTRHDRRQAKRRSSTPTTRWSACSCPPESTA